jgi:predicted heme/steroid binding protein
MRTLTREELRRYQGQDGAPICFACHGKVYDASKSWHWRGAVHQVSHAAGEDLTEALATAPHGIELIARLPIIGVLQE